jgi:hypothetical protein
MGGIRRVLNFKKVFRVAVLKQPDFASRFRQRESITMRKMMIAAAAALVTVSTAALATVDVDDLGNGFVGKGDVQLKYGWNDQALQTKAAGVSFFVNVDEEYKYDCTFTVEVGGKVKTQEPQTTRRGKTVKVNSGVAYDARINAKSKITGFNLNGFGEDISATGTVPVDGGSCPGGPLGDGVISNVELNDTTGGLFVSYDGKSFPLPNTI